MEDKSSSTVTIHRQAAAATTMPSSNPLPTLLHTPAGLALLELQGSFNLPGGGGAAAAAAGDEGGLLEDEPTTGKQQQRPGVPIGRLDFPDFDPTQQPDSTAWMHRVHMYVGAHQRLTGEVKKLPRPVAVVRRRQQPGGEDGSSSSSDLEVVDVIHYKLLFSQRPEPMTTSFS